MLTRTTRALSETEREILVRMAELPPDRIVYWDTCCFTMLVGFGAWMLGALAGLVPFEPDSLVTMVLAAVCGLLPMAALGVREHQLSRRAWAHRQQAIARALEHGQVEELHATVEAVITMELDEDTGTGYFLDLGDRQMLYLRGDSYFGAERPFRPDDEGGLPTDELRLIRTVADEIELSFESLGSTLRPLGVYEDYYEAEKATQYSSLLELEPKNGELFTGSLDTLVEDLRTHQARG